MAEIVSNEASNEQFSFKLTQQVLSSFANSNGILSHPEDSLEYSHSRISIQLILQEADREEQILHSHLETSSPPKNLSSLTKESSIKASSINTTQATIRTISRPRALSMKQSVTAKDVNQKLSFRVFQFEDALSVQADQRDRKSQGWEERRKLSKSQKKENNGGMLTSRSSVHTARSHCQKQLPNSDFSLLKLKQSVQIRQMDLRMDEQRQKNYLKRIIQARSNNTHMTESLPIPLLTRWRPSNRFR